MTKLVKWEADFKNDPSEINRKKWNEHRDLYVTVMASDIEDARVKVFEQAHKFLKRPFLGMIRPISNVPMKNRKGHK